MARVLRQPRWIAVAVWLSAFAVSIAVAGYPTRRTSVALWVILAVLAIGIERPRATLTSFATTWLPLFVALGAYDRLRGASDPAAQSAAHTWPHLDLDRWLGGGTTPSEHLQSWLWTPGHPHWWDFGAWVVYQSHFVVPLLVAAAMWGLRHHLAQRYVLGLALLSGLALLTYWLYPAQPPWMVARDGLTGDLDRIVPQVWKEVGVERADRVFTTHREASANRFANPVAALPSLHAAFPMLIAGFLWSARRRVNALLAAYAVAMAVTLVYTGEHFVFDIVLGWTYALAVAVLLRRYQRRRSSIDPMIAGSQLDEVGIGGRELERPTALSR